MGHPPMRVAHGGNKIKSLQCPNCANGITPNKRIFREAFYCPRCGVTLHVSPPYWRCLVLLGAVIAYALVWASGVQGAARFFVFWLPVWFLVMSIAVRVVPHIIGPKFVLYSPETWGKPGDRRDVLRFSADLIRRVSCVSKIDLEAAKPQCSAALDHFHCSGHKSGLVTEEFPDWDAQKPGNVPSVPDYYNSMLRIANAISNNVTCTSLFGR